MKRHSIKLDFVRLALVADAINGKNPVSVREHKNGIPVAQADGTFKLMVNESSGERSEEKRPFVVVGFSQQSGTQPHSDVSPHWGRYRQDGTIAWQGIDPNVLLTFLNGFLLIDDGTGKLENAPMNDANYIWSIALNVDRAFWGPFRKMDILDGYERLEKLGYEPENVGQFITIPSDNPVVGGLDIKPFNIERGNTTTVQKSVTRFVHQDEIDRGPRFIARAFIQKDVSLTITSIDQKSGQVVTFLNQTILEKEQADRTLEIRDNDTSGTGNSKGNEGLKAGASSLYLPQFEAAALALEAENKAKLDRMNEIKAIATPNPDEALELENLQKEFGSNEVKLETMKA